MYHVLLHRKALQIWPVARGGGGIEGGGGGENNPPSLNFYSHNPNGARAPVCWRVQPRSAYSTLQPQLPSPFPGQIPPTIQKQHILPGITTIPSCLPPAVPHFPREPGLAKYKYVMPSYAIKHCSKWRHTAAVG